MPSFTEEDIRRINYIKEMYEKHGLNSNVPEVFQVEQVNNTFLKFLTYTTTQPKKPPVKSDYDEMFIISKLHNGPYSRYAEDIIRCICEYQRSKNKKSDDCDSYDLFFYEIQEWAKSKLSCVGESSTNDFLDELKKRLSYILSIKKSDLFVADVKFNHTLSDVQDILEKVKCEIILFQENKSAQIILKDLVQAYEKMMQHCIQYIYYISNSDIDLPKDCTIDNLTNPPSTSPIKHIMELAQGKYLQQLLHEAPFSLLFHDQRITRITHDHPALLLSRCIIKKDLDNMRTFLCNIKPITSTEREDLIALEKALFGNKDLPKLYFKLLNLLQYIAVYTLIFDRLIRIAGIGGDITIYGLLNNQVKIFVEQFFELTDELQLTTTYISDQSKIYSRRLAKEEKRDRLNSNLHITEELHELLDKDFKKCKSILSEITSKSIESDIRDLLSKFEEELAVLYTLTREVKGHSADILKKLKLITNLKKQESEVNPPLNAANPKLTKALSQSDPSLPVTQMSRLSLLPPPPNNPPPRLQSISSSINIPPLKEETTILNINLGAKITAMTGLSTNLIICGLTNGNLYRCSYPELNFSQFLNKQHDAPIIFLRVIKNQILVSASKDGIVCKWSYNALSQDVVINFKSNNLGIINAVTCDDKGRIYLAIKSGIIKVLDTSNNMRDLVTTNYDFSYIKISNDALFACRFDGRLNIYSIQEPLQLHLKKCIALPWSKWAVSGPVGLLTSSTIIMSESDTSDSINNYLPGIFVKYLIYWLDIDKETFIPFKGSAHKYPIQYIEITENSAYIMSSSNDCCKLWDAKSLEFIRDIPITDQLNCILEMPNASIIISSGEDKLSKYTIPILKRISSEQSMSASVSLLT